jgi:hypothetical protein
MSGKRQLPRDLPGQCLSFNHASAGDFPQVDCLEKLAHPVENRTDIG